MALSGRSLGGAVALAAAAGASRAPRPATTTLLAGVVVENTFLFIEAVAPALLPVLRPFLGPGKPLGRLLRSNWRNDLPVMRPGRRPALTPPPVLLLSSLKDEMLPPAHMRQLWFALAGRTERARTGATARPPAAASPSSSARLRWVAFPDGRHLDAYDACAAQYRPSCMGGRGRWASP